MSKTNRSIVGAVALVGLLGAAGEACATPYAYASNQITGLTITYVGGGNIAPSNATESVSDSAQVAGLATSAFQNQGALGGALGVAQAYSGPGSAPAATFTAAGPGTFTGARANAAIGAGTLSSGISMSDVAEGYGALSGNSAGSDGASIPFTVAGTGAALSVSFSDLVQLIVSTDPLVGETAIAAIQNSFSITAAGSTTPLATFSPTVLNRQITSTAGVPSSDQTGPTTYVETFTTPLLLNGVTYTIAFTSIASETIRPGGPVATPEPPSMLLLGAGLAGLYARTRLGSGRTRGC